MRRPGANLPTRRPGRHHGQETRNSKGKRRYEGPVPVAATLVDHVLVPLRCCAGAYRMLCDEQEAMTGGLADEAAK
jgi:hypothetical protein